MRFLIAAAAASFLLLPVQGIAAPKAGSTVAAPQTIELLAKTKKKAKTVKKKKAPKVEYMRAAPSK